MKPLLLLILLGACVAPSGDAGPEPSTPAEIGATDPEAAAAEAKPPERPLPAGFEVRADPEVTAAFLGPEGTWRQLKSRLTTLQADVRRGGKDVLLSFEPQAMHVTRQDGTRQTWALPAGLAFTVEIPHVLVRADLTLAGFAADGVQVPFAEELTVAIVTLTEGESPTREFRLVIKGGTAFRSMTSG